MDINSIDSIKREKINAIIKTIPCPIHGKTTQVELTDTCVVFHGGYCCETYKKLISDEIDIQMRKIKL